MPINTPMARLTDKISKWDELIRAGQLEEVRAQVRKVLLKNVARPDRIELAKICRRVHLFSLATKVLFSVIRGDSSADATVEEISEYSASLLRIGSVQEVRSLLANVANSDFPQVSLHRAFAEIVEWNHAQAIDQLKQYLQFSTITDYQRLVAEVNLSLSLVGCHRLEEARVLLQKLISESKRSNHHLVYAISLCYLGHVFLLSDDFGAAKTTLLEARESVPKADYQHQLLIDKLMMIMHARSGVSEITPTMFDEIKARAQQHGVFEIIRDCDYAKARWLNDSNAFHSVLVGTPYTAYRSKCKEMKFEPSNTICILKKDLGDVSCSIDIPSDIFDLEEPNSLTAGDGTHRALVALTEDFYRPQSLGGFHEILYPHTYFDPFTAHNRLHQVILRLRTWIEHQGYLWKIKIDPSGILFTNSGGTPLRLPVERSQLRLSTGERLLLRFFEAIGHSPFRLETLNNLQICTKSQAVDCLRSSVVQGYVEKSGKGRYTSYRFKKLPFAA